MTQNTLPFRHLKNWRMTVTADFHNLPNDNADLVLVGPNPSD